MDNDLRKNRRQAIRRKGFVWTNKSATLSGTESRESHWYSDEDLSPTRAVFRCSSLDLAPSLLSIYDSLALENNLNSDGINQSESQNGSHDTILSNQEHPIAIQVISNECDTTDSDSIMELEGQGKISPTGRSDLDPSECKKRPLSVGSGSSSSSSSLSHHVIKKPNLCSIDSSSSKLEHILYIDDEKGDQSMIQEKSIASSPDISVSDLSPNKNEEEVVDTCKFVISRNQSHGVFVDQEVGPESSEDTSPQTTKTAIETVSTENSKSVSVSQNSLRLPSSHSSPSISASECSSVVSVDNASSVLQPSQNTPTSQSRPPDSPTKYVTRVQRVISEIVDTERTYVSSLNEIIQGYMKYLKCSTHLRLSSEDKERLFGNLLQIYEFSGRFLVELESCEDNAAQIAECFVRNNDGFSVYTEYCTNYPSAVEILTRVMKDVDLSEIFKTLQLHLKHSLPLGAYLLKPVQRILKYHLLLHNIVKNFDKTEEGYDVVVHALEQMTGRAQHINEMKRKHEHAVRVQEIQSTLEEYDGEDLTTLGELVLEGAFHVYGAKTSRQVFLFEKGVVIAKRKEDSMLSCKVFILCSNLMLVESVPKEPLSFQVIPFDNPRGQHTLQARNLDQKRKWCQEIKRLILESYKEKIPEKVKGLVMQLGKSKQEENVDSGTPQKFHHQNAPEYLERRQRLRRKSGGNILSDILKPQRARRNQKRNESESPRTSPTERRKFASSPAKQQDSGNNQIKVNGSKENQENATSKTSLQREHSSPMLGSKNDEENFTNKMPLKRENSSPVSRSTSFRTAVRRQPLTSVDYSDEKLSETKNGTTETSPTKRTKSFRLATRLNPLLTNVLASHSSSSLPDAPSVHQQEELPPPSQDGEFRSDNSTLDQRYCSMPALTKPLSPFTNRPNSKVEDRQSSRRLSSNSFNLGSPSKKVIDIKQYFSRNKENLEDSQNLKQESKSVTAFHDSYLKKSAETSPDRSPKIYPRTISLTKPLSVSSVFQTQQKSQVSVEKDNEDPWVVNPKASTEDILTTSASSGGQYRLKRSPAKKKSHQRSRSVDFEVDEDSQNFDWIVYANRNSLPLSGFPKGSVPHLEASLKPDSEHLASHSRSKSFDDTLSAPNPVLTQSATEPTLQSLIPSSEKEISVRNNNQSSNSQGSQKYQGSYSSTIPSRGVDQQSLTSTPSQKSPYPLSYIYGAYTTADSNEIDSYGDSWRSKYFNSPRFCDQIQNISHDTPLEEDAHFLSSLPVIVRKVDEPSHAKISRSYSTPCANNVERVQGARPQSFNINLNDHEKLVAEMEDYLKRSDSNITISSQQRFPVPNLNDSSKESSNRFSYASTISGSSYESSESLTDNQSSDSIVDSLKLKTHGKENLNRRSGSYDNTVPEVITESDKDNKASIWSLNTWFSSPKKEPLPDLQTVLHAGELGSATIGSRMAHQEPLYAEFPNLSKASPESHSRNSVSVSVRAETLHDEPVNLKQCDSAYSIQSEEETSCRDLPKRTNLTRADSFYEKRLSMAFNDTEVFRDSAVFCDIDTTELSPEVKYEKESPIRSPVEPAFEREGRKKRLPVKQFVKELEEQYHSKSTETVRVRHREPGTIIRQRMESLEKQTRRSQSCSRPNSIERDLRRSSTPVRSVSSSPGRDFRRSSTPARSMTASPIMENELNRKSSSNWSSTSITSGKAGSQKDDGKPSSKMSSTKQTTERLPFRSRSISQDRGANQRNSLTFPSGQTSQKNTAQFHLERPFRSRFLSEDCRTSQRLSLPRSSVNASMEDISSERYYKRERSAPPFGDQWSGGQGMGGKKHSMSLGRLDQLSTDIENLVIMKGWVRQLIEKFQPNVDEV
ncbi:pleckstrin homology domain-containing family G member 3-like isoform X2 [Saccostrea echinata]|uniref:pleckstrin homology domain-containing family G member 3-like isoform X2 n=1 Tax=Saccostrea echinata TaxID=191078 RepID=UPI002A82ADF2|nr:pleckstrin homology domain-containing family G member 3-like isoform X2 [Saccostrea echinata]